MKSVSTTCILPISITKKDLSNLTHFYPIVHWPVPVVSRPQGAGVLQPASPGGAAPPPCSRRWSYHTILHHTCSRRSPAAPCPQALQTASAVCTQPRGRHFSSCFSPFLLPLLVLLLMLLMLLVVFDILLLIRICLLLLFLPLILPQLYA